MGSKRLDLEEFVKRSRLKHGDRYDYSKVVWVNTTTKVEIVCTEHGSFWQLPDCHYKRGHTCPACSGHKRIDTEEFVRRATAVHGNKYDYSKAVPAGAHSKVEIICHKHGSFWQEVNAHIRQQQGCPACSDETKGKWNASDGSEFISKAVALHGTKYDYSLVQYIRSNRKVKIGCRTCGNVFEQSPNGHLSGKGCRTCNRGGFTETKPGYVYVLKSGNVTKVGITNVNPKVRADHVSRDSGRDFEVYDSFILSAGKDALEIEANMLAALRETGRSVKLKFHGSTECFEDVDSEYIAAVIGARAAIANQARSL